MSALHAPTSNIKKTHRAKSDDLKPVMTITFGDVAENHAHMQRIGEKADRGFTLTELTNANKVLSEANYITELIDINTYLPSSYERQSDSAAILIVRNGVNFLLADHSNADELLSEHINLAWDTKAKMRGKVVNKHARYNLCYSDAAQEPAYDAGRGRIIAWEQVPVLNHIRSQLPNLIGEAANGLNAEGNLYFDSSKCGIGFHGDAERRKVIALRLGDTMPLHYQWFHMGDPIGDRVKITLNHGDLYIMGDKAVGSDWMCRQVPTLRHAAGCEKYLKIKDAQ